MKSEAPTSEFRWLAVGPELTLQQRWAVDRYSGPDGKGNYVICVRSVTEWRDVPVVAAEVAV